MRCLVINLDRSPDRLAHMTAEFARIGIAFERVAAIDALDRPDLADMPQRTAAEFRRLGRQIKDIYLRKKKKIIPFDHRGGLVLPPHTQRRENAL